MRLGLRTENKLKGGPILVQHRRERPVIEVKGGGGNFKNLRWHGIPPYKDLLSIEIKN